VSKKRKHSRNGLIRFMNPSQARPYVGGCAFCYPDRLKTFSTQDDFWSWWNEHMISDAHVVNQQSNERTQQLIGKLAEGLSLEQTPSTQATTQPIGRKATHEHRSRYQ